MPLRPFPVPQQERLVDLGELDPQAGGAEVGPQYLHFDVWRQHNRTFECMGTCSFWGSNLTTSNHAERVGVLLATHDYFDVLGSGTWWGDASPPRRIARADRT
jgi:hypothetical protein